jgi:hypothetical protein
VAEKSRAEELHDEYRKKVWEDSTSQSESFDRYLLTLSGGALALSITFLKEVVPLQNAVCIPLLIVSWVWFILCILITLISFRISIQALEKMVPFLNEFYLEGNAEAFNKHLESLWTKAVDWCAYAGIIFFVLGLLFTMMFVGANLLGGKTVSQENVTKVSSSGDMNKGAKPPAMTPLQEGVKPAGMTPVQSTPAQPPQTKPAPAPVQSQKK